MSPVLVVADPKKYLDKFVACWLKIIQDFERLDHVKPDEVQFWAVEHRKTHKKTEPRSAHRFLPGLCRTWSNKSADFCISLNRWAVKVLIPDSGDEADMVLPFIIVFWACYTSHMIGRPALETDTCQTVLKYLLTNRTAVVKTWRARLYFYSSGTVFKAVMPPLRTWLEEDKTKRSLLLKHIKDEDGLYQVLSDVIFAFISTKTQPFPNATRSQQHFWDVPVWKRAMIFVFLCRQVLDEYSKRQWKDYDYSDYVFGEKTFNKYMKRDGDVMYESKLLKELTKGTHTAKKRKQTFVPTPQKQRKKVFVIDIDLCTSDSE